MGANFAAALNKYAHSKMNRINKKTEEKINKALHKLGEETRDKIRHYISQGWYNHSYEDYTRTHGLWESVQYVVSGHTVRVYFDMRMLRGRRVNDGKGWQPHRNFSIPDGRGNYISGEDFTEGLVSWIEEGGEGSPKNPYYGHGGVHMIQRTRKWLDEYLDKETRKIVGEILKESGLAK